jgi:hypothetical protein
VTKDEENRQNSKNLEWVVSEYNCYFQTALGFLDCGNKGKGKKYKDHHYFIPSSPIQTLTFLRIARNHIRKRDGKIRKMDHKSLLFFDCGCGIGNIILLSRSMGGYGRGAGIEYDKATYEMAKMLIPSADIINGDLVDFDHYDKYDVIYYYEPIISIRKRRIFINKLMNGAKVGAVIIGNGVGASDMRRSSKFRKVSRKTSLIYEKMRM